MSYKYDVAVSFAGEDRKLVEPIAIELYKKGIQIFYDLLEQADLWGKDLYQHLSDIYSTKSKFCIIFVSKYYIEKEWTKLELRSAQSRAFKQDNEYILPIRLDNTVLPGLPDTIGYLDINRLPIDKIVEIIIKKIGKEDTNLNKQQTLLFWKIRSVVNAHDPMSLLFVGKNTPFGPPPSDEYDPEVEEIYDVLPTTESPNDLAIHIRDIFIKYFSKTSVGDINEYLKMAYEIWTLKDGESFQKLYNYPIYYEET